MCFRTAETLEIVVFLPLILGYSPLPAALLAQQGQHRTITADYCIYSNSSLCSYVSRDESVLGKQKPSVLES